MASIYGLYDPRDETLRYVGVTVLSLDARLAGHLTDDGDYRRCRWIAGIRKVGLVPTIRLLETVEDDDRWDAERRWIALARQSGADLTNTSDGGEGRTGPLPLVTRQKMSAARKGRPKSPEHRAAISAGLRGKPKPPKTDEWRAAHSLKMTGRRHSEETKAKISAAHRGQKRPALSVVATQRRRGPDGRFA